MVTALDAPATRRCLRRRWLGCLALVLGAVLLVGLVGWLRHSDRNSTERDGARATGTVESVEMRSIGGHTSGSLTVRFVDDDGVARLATVPLDERIRRFAAGDQVELAYPLGRPDDIVLVGITEPVPMPWAVPALGAALLAGLAADVAVRLRRCARVLARNPWVAVRSREIQVPLGAGGGGVMAVLELHGAPDDGVDPGRRRLGPRPADGRRRRRHVGGRRRPPVLPRRGRRRARRAGQAGAPHRSGDHRRRGRHAAALAPAPRSLTEGVAALLSFACASATWR